MFYQALFYFSLVKNTHFFSDSYYLSTLFYFVFYLFVKNSENTLFASKSIIADIEGIQNTVGPKTGHSNTGNIKEPDVFAN